MDNMHVVRLTYRVTPSFYNFRNGRQKKLISPVWVWKSAVIKVKKINTVIIKQCWFKFFLDFFMLFLHRPCYFAVSFALFWRPEFIKTIWCLSNVCVINSSRKNVYNFFVKKVRYVYQRKYSKSKNLFLFYPNP